MFTEAEMAIIALAREGRLVCKEPYAPLGAFDDAEVLRLEKLHLLVGAKNFATEFGSCFNCPWVGHAHFDMSKEDSSNAQSLLHHFHRETGCEHTYLKFELYHE